MRIYKTKNGDFRDIPMSRYIKGIMKELHAKTGKYRYVFMNHEKGKL